MSEGLSQGGAGGRSGAIDAVRIIGVIAVVAGHVWLVGPVRLVTFPWHVPVFYFLTGSLWNPNRVLRDEWRRRFRSLGVPYIAWFVLIFVAFVSVELATDAFSLKTAALLVYGGYYDYRPFTTFWFLSSLLFVTVVFRAMGYFPWWGQVLLAVGGVLVGAVAGPALSRLPLALGSVVYCMIFVVAGSTLTRLRLPVGWGVLMGAVLLAVSVILVALGISAPLDLKAGNVGTPVLSVMVAIAISWGLLLVSQAVFVNLSSRFSNLVSRVAAPAIMVVLLHPVVLWLLDTPRSGRFTDFVLAVIIPWVFGLIIARTRVAPVLLGGSKTMPAAGQVRRARQ